jgi:arsenical pump membrane protein
MATQEAEVGDAAGGRSTGGDAVEVTGRPVLAMLPRLALWALVLGLELFADPDPALSLLLIALAGVATIVTDSRFAWERRVEAAGVPSREAWVPLAMGALMFALDLVDLDGLGDVIADKGPVVLFILAFALVAEGLGRSGFIHFLAYRVTDRGAGNTTRVTLYLFLLSSVLTYFTSNDIVVLTMTPIVMSVAYQARIANAKLLLLSQFIAANTVSMGILIGSPTNLIVGRALDIDFVGYLLLMLAPSAVALMITFVFVTWVNNRAGRSRGRLFGSWAYAPGYTPPRLTRHRTFTPNMRTWVVVFAASVTVLAVGTATDTGLLLAAVAIAVTGLVMLHRDHRLTPDDGADTGDDGAGAPARDRSTRTFATQTLRVLPFGIVFFGFTYFLIADAIADTPVVREDVNDYVTDNATTDNPLPSWGSMLAAGTLVNTMNDLPASALAGTVVERADFDDAYDEAVTVQGVLAGLNTATYVTPVGALAGIIWFDILRKERQRQRALGAGALDVVTPSRRDLVLYGTITFLATTLVLGATNYGFVTLAETVFATTGAAQRAWMAAGLAVAAATVVAFVRVLGSAGITVPRLVRTRPAPDTD